MQLVIKFYRLSAFQISLFFLILRQVRNLSAVRVLVALVVLCHLNKLWCLFDLWFIFSEVGVKQNYYLFTSKMYSGSETERLK